MKSFIINNDYMAEGTEGDIPTRAEVEATSGASKKDTGRLWTKFEQVSVPPPDPLEMARGKIREWERIKEEMWRYARELERINFAERNIDQQIFDAVNNLSSYGWRTQERMRVSKPDYKTLNAELAIDDALELLNALQSQKASIRYEREILVNNMIFDSGF